METLQGIPKFDKAHPTAVTIGTFDGVHIGHFQLLNRLTNSAKDAGLKSTVLTFFPHPRMVLQKDANIKLLNTLDEKVQILEKTGLDYLIIHPFTKKFSRLSAVDFVRDILVNGLNCKKVIIGYDHRFGRNRTANINDLISFGNTFDFKVEEIPVKEVEDVSVSSTKIRKALHHGDVATANEYLGYEYMLTGSVEKGKGLGRELGFATANLNIPETYKLIPKNGVYLVKSNLSDKTVFGMMNIGFNPTVEPDATTESIPHIEIHFFDFNENLYDKKIQVRILQRLRDEEKFDSLDDLKSQLQQDKDTSLQLIKGQGA